MEWKDGYIIDSVYTHNFWRKWSPAELTFTALLNKIAPPPLDRFRYLDLGCGHGTQLVLLAAANPQGTFVGVDFNPQHIETGENLRRELGLANLSFICASFDELLEAPPDGFKDFNYIVAHGVYAWISNSARAALCRIMRKAAAPGGVAYVSYNAMPGNCASAALQKFILGIAERVGGPNDEAAHLGLLVARGLRARGATGFFDLPTINMRLTLKNDSRKAYLAHEYLNREWRAFYFAEVHAAMAQEGLAYAGSCEPIHAFPDLMHKQEFFDYLPNPKDVVWRETTSDFYFNRQFRTDLYHNAAVGIDDEERIQGLQAMSFGMASAPEHWEEPVKSADDKEIIGAELRDALKTLFAVGNPTGAAIALAIARHQPGLDLPRVIAALFQFRDVCPILPIKVDPEPSRRFNRMACAERPYGARFKHLTSSICGTGIGMDQSMALSMMTFEAGALEARLNAAIKILAERGEPLVQNDKTITDPVEQRLALARLFLLHQERLHQRFDLLGISL